MPRPEAARDVRVVHRDEQLLVLYKPPGLPTTSPGGRGCLTELAADLDPTAPRLHPTSRLDAEVSGLVTFARTRHATRALLDARRRGAYGRTYLALASAAPAAPGGRWDAAIALDPADRRRRVALAPTAAASRLARARPASTDYLVRETSAAGPCLLELHPHTGRTHQLRVHAAHAGLPLLGDVPYGGPRRVVLPDGRVLTARRVMLHCAALTLPSPAGGDPLDLSAPLPHDMQQLWAALRP